MNTPKRKPNVAPACESLEGRQLLASGADMGMGMAMGGGMPPMAHGGPADVASTEGGRSETSGRSWGRQGSPAQDSASFPMDGFGPGGSSRGSAGSMSIQAGPMAGFGMDGAARGSTSLAQAGPMGGFGGSMGGFGGSPGMGMMMMSPGGMGGTGGDSTAVPTQLQTDLDKLATDQQAIHDKSQVTPALEAKVREDIKTIKMAITKPADASALATLEKDQKAAWANAGGPTDDQLAQVQADQDAVYKSQGVSSELITLLDADLAAIKTAAGVTDADKATLAADQKAIDADRAALDAANAADTDTTATPASSPPATPTDAPALAASATLTATDASATPTTLAPTPTAAATPTPAAPPTTLTPATPTAVPAVTPTAHPMSTLAAQAMTPTHARGHGHHFGGFGRSARRHR